MIDWQEFDAISKESMRVIAAVQYLRQFPEDIKSQQERLYLQRQFLIDIIHELKP